MAYPTTKSPSKRKIKRRKRTPGRKERGSQNKFTKRRRFIIYEALRTKLPMKRASSLAGLSVSRLLEWINMGKDKKRYPVHAEFRRRIRKIQAQHEQDALDIIDMAARGGKKIIETKVVIGPKGKEVVRIKKYTPATWQAAAWYLERRHRNEYGRDHYGKDDPNKKSAEELAQEVKKIADRLFESVPS